MSPQRGGHDPLMPSGETVVAPQKDMTISHAVASRADSLLWASMVLPLEAFSDPIC